jgi:hypothetical protein
MTEHLSSPDPAATEAQRAVNAGNDVRAEVRDLTLRLLREHRLDPRAAAAALRSIAAGVTAGVADKPEAAKRLLTEAFEGTDEALAKVATALRLVLLELQGKGRDVAAEEWQPALRQLARLERELIDTYARAARATAGAAKQEISALVEHVERAGTDTGSVARRTLAELPAEVAHLVGDTLSAGLGAAGQSSARLLDATIGALEGISESFRKKA